MVDRPELEPHLAWLKRSGCRDRALREAAMAIELAASGHGNALVRCGVAWLSARCVVEILGLEELVERDLDRLGRLGLGDCGAELVEPVVG